MKENYTVIALIVDRSGSMQGVEDDTIGGVNAFIEQQKELPGDVSLTLVLFDDIIETIHDFKDINEIPQLTDKVYFPRGMTALLDAIGITSRKIGERLAAMPEAERPSKVIVAVITDGRENNSKEFTLKKIRKMIQEQENVYNWDFSFISADLNAIDDAARYGFSSGRVAHYNKAHSSETFAAMSQKVKRTRQGGKADFMLNERRLMEKGIVEED